MVYTHISHMFIIYIQKSHIYNHLSLFLFIIPSTSNAALFYNYIHTHTYIGIHSYTNTQRNLYILTTKFLPCRNRAEESRAVYRNTYYFIRRVCCCVLFYVIHAFFFLRVKVLGSFSRPAVLDPFFQWCNLLEKRYCTVYTSIYISSV